MYCAKEIKRRRIKIIHVLVVVLPASTFFCWITLAKLNHEESDSPKNENILGSLFVEERGAAVKEMQSEKGRPFHVAVTVSGDIYMEWQIRIMYYWYKKMKYKPGSEMGGFTRILHSGKPDDLMEEIPTFVVPTIPNAADEGYIVLNRPWAFLQWLYYTQIKEEYILMAEPDHIFLRPLPNLSNGENPVGYPFFYIKPEKHESIMRRFYPPESGPLSNIDPIGSSPVIIKKDLLENITTTWLNISIKIRYDIQASNTIGWVQEMYGYAIAASLHGVRHMLRPDFMLQPPWDLKIGENFILHYTYRLDYNEKGHLTFGNKSSWGFNKRDYGDSFLPQNLTMPPKGTPETVVTLMRLINEASLNIPNWNKNITR